ncbi:MAG: hypothetical protein HY648_08650 [Acidobacteria bacterium]|nr:hypothetical protein [Acidobacteriota bacterium]
MRVHRLKSWLGGLLLSAVAGNAFLSDAFAYCATCYAGAAGAGDKGIRALQLGIVVLLIPTGAILGGILWTAFRRQDSDNLPDTRSIAEMQENWQEPFGETGSFSKENSSLPAVNPR